MNNEYELVDFSGKASLLINVQYNFLMIQLSTICRANSFRIIVIFLSYYFYNPYLPPYMPENCKIV